jgi:prenylated cyclic peptide (anacyclamide/piricyclamide family)
MTKKNLRPQQVAPVQRETNATSKDQIGQVTPQYNAPTHDANAYFNPFAGDDAE